MLHRFPSGVDGEKVHQKRVPKGAPPWLQTVRITFPRFDRTADELCVTELASVIWAVQMSTVEFHPWNSRCADVERPDEWRIDLDPMPDCSLDRVRRVAPTAHEVLARDRRHRLAQDLGRPRASTSTCASSPRTASLTSAGPRWRSRARWSAAFRTTRPPRGGARTAPPRRSSSTTTRTPGTTRSPRPTRCAATSDGTVSAPIAWDEIDDVQPQELTIATMPERFAQLGDLHAGIDEAVVRRWSRCSSGPSATSAPAGRPGGARRRRRAGAGAGADCHPWFWRPEPGGASGCRAAPARTSVRGPGRRRRGSDAQAQTEGTARRIALQGTDRRRGRGRARDRARPARARRRSRLDRAPGPRGQPCSTARLPSRRRSAAGRRAASASTSCSPSGTWSTSAMR